MIEKQNTNNMKYITCPSNSLNGANDLGKCWKIFLACPIQGTPN